MSWKPLSALAQIARKSPSVFVAPIAVFLALACAGVAVTYHSAGQATDEAKAQASQLARTAATHFAGQLVTAMSPVEIMAAMVMEDPTYDVVARRFAGMGAALNAGAPTLDALRLSPAGVIRLVTPSSASWMVGMDSFASANALTAQATRFAVVHGGLAMDGPLAPEPGAPGGEFLVIRRAIFAPASGPNDTFGQPDAINPCCGAPCAYNASSGTRFWGFATAVVNMASFSRSPDAQLTLHPILALHEAGLRYTLRAAHGAVVLASDKPPRDPVVVPVSLPGTQWTLLVSGHRQWRPLWLPGVLVMVVVCSAVASSLLFVVLLTRRRNQELLEALLPRDLIRGLHKNGAGAVLGARQAVTDSPAELLHGLLAGLLAGASPDLRDVVLLRSLLMQGAPWYAPVNAADQIKNSNLDTEVVRALIQQLGKNSFDGAQMGNGRPAIATGAGKAAASLGDCLDPVMASGDGLAAEGEALQQLQQQQEDDNARCQTFRGALHLIMVPELDTAPAAHDSPLTASAYRFPIHTPATAEASGHACGGPLDAALAASGGEGPQDLSSLMQQQQLWQGAAKAPRVPPQQPLQHYRHTSMLTRMGYSLSGYMASAPIRLAGGGSAAAGSAYPRLHRLSNIQLPVAKTAARRRSYGPSTASVTPLDADACPADGLHGRVGRTLGLGLEAPAVGARTRRGASLDQTAVMVEGDQPVAAALSGSGCLLLLQARASADCASPPRSHAQRASDNRAACLLMTAPSYAAMMAAQASAESQEAGAHTSSGRGEGWPAAQGGTQEDEVEVEVEVESEEAMVAAAPSAAMMDEVERLLVHVDGLQYDTWALDAATGSHALSAMGFFLLQREGLLARFSVPPVRLVRLLHALEAGYPANPYHNQVHAADVLRSLHVLLRASRLAEHYVDHLGLLAAYFVAMIHDHGHPGLTGDFLVATSHPLALRYNDRSPLENHHAASAFELLAARPDLDITEGMSRDEKAAFRKQVIEMVLATDMKQHFALLGNFNATAHRRAAAPAAAAGAAEGGRGAAPDAAPRGAGGTAGAAMAAGAEGQPAQRQLSKNQSQGALRSMISGASSTKGNAAGESSGGVALCGHRGSSSGGGLTAPMPVDEAERLVSLQVALKVADIGHLAGELAVHKRWLGVLEEEFFRQGDRERELGLPISPLFDRAKQGVSKSQVGFFDFVVLPLVRAFASAFPGAQTVLACYEANHQHWLDVQQQQQQS